MQTDGFVTADKVKNAYLGLGVKQDTTKDNKVFPVPSNSTCNNILKLTGKQCAIKALLTYHLARHTFATLSIISPEVPIETVSKMDGAYEY